MVDVLVCRSIGRGTCSSVEDGNRYGDLTDEFEQMHSAEAPVPEGTVIAFGKYMADLIAEMMRYLISRN